MHKSIVSIIVSLHFFNQFISFVSRLFIRTKILKKIVIVRVDGGICSQMYFYAIGQFFASKGYTVKYDITWFQKYGIDIIGKDKRTFDLLKAFPDLHFTKANKLEIILYRPFIYHNNYTDTSSQSSAWMNLEPPVYLQGYYRTPVSFIPEHFNMFRFDSNVLDSSNKEMLSFILQKNESVAVHVRRGDLSDYHSIYGSPVTVNYFASAINYFYERLSSPFFFFFSDDILYVKDELINNLKLTENYYIVNLNDPTKGYMDLFLIAACHHFITSKGSLGKYGSMLRNDKDSMVVLYDDSREQEWRGKLQNITYLI